MLYLSGRRYNHRNDEEGRMETIFWLTLSSLCYFNFFYLLSPNSMGAAPTDLLRNCGICSVLILLNNIIFIGVINEERTYRNIFAMGAFPLGTFLLIRAHFIAITMCRCIIGFIILALLMAGIRFLRIMIGKWSRENVWKKKMFRYCFGRVYEVCTVICVLLIMVLGFNSVRTKLDDFYKAKSEYDVADNNANDDETVEDKTTRKETSDQSLENDNTSENDGKVSNAYNNKARASASLQISEILEQKKNEIYYLSPYRYRELTADQRLYYLQIYLDCELLYLGCPWDCQIVIREMDDCLAGYYSDYEKVVAINREILMSDSPCDAVGTIAHEAYHAYQHACIEEFRNSGNESSLYVAREIERWDREFNNYIEVTDSNIKEQKDAYNSQWVEISAEGFRLVQLQEFINFINIVDGSDM